MISTFLKSTDQSFCRMSLSLVLCNASEWLGLICILGRNTRNGTVSFSVHDIRRYLVKMFARLLHCKVTIILFIFSKCLVGRYFETIYILFLVTVSLTNFSVHESCMKQVILWGLPFSDFSDYLKFKFMSLRGKDFKNITLIPSSHPKTN